MFDFKLTDMPIGKFNKIEVKESSGKGLGVFASKNIKKGEYICWYDGIYVSNEAGLELKDRNLISNLITGKLGYGQNLSKGNDVIAGFTKEFRKGGVAQLVNDYSKTTDEYESYKNVRDKKYNSDMERIYDASGNFKYLYFVAVKNIKKGEEILHYYGVDYWKNNGDSKLFKIVCGIPEYNLDNNHINDYLNRAIISSKLIASTIIASKP